MAVQSYVKTSAGILSLAVALSGCQGSECVRKQDVALPGWYEKEHGAVMHVLVDLNHDKNNDILMLRSRLYTFDKNCGSEYALEAYYGTGRDREKDNVCRSRPQWSESRGDEYHPYIVCRMDFLLRYYYYDPQTKYEYGVDGKRIPDITRYPDFSLLWVDKARALQFFTDYDLNKDGVKDIILGESTTCENKKHVEAIAVLYGTSFGIFMPPVKVNEERLEIMLNK